MECVDCGKNIPSFVLRCSECQKKFNRKKSSSYTIMFSGISTDPNRTYTNLTADKIPDDLIYHGR